MATRAAMQRVEESVKETKKMAEQLELVNAHAQQVETRWLQPQGISSDSRKEKGALCRRQEH